MDDNRQAWHAGESQLDGVWYCNAYSLGIELSHRDNCAPYPQIQAEALTWLCRNLIATYAIPKNAVATHRQVAEPAGRKTDPTDWSDADFAIWRTSLYITDPLKARTIPGPPGQPPKYCSVPMAQFYAARGGLAHCGYPLVDEFRSTFGTNDAPCAVLPCERVILKESPQYGVEQALLSEAKVEGWLL